SQACATATTSSQVLPCCGRQTPKRIGWPAIAPFPLTSTRAGCAIAGLLTRAAARGMERAMNEQPMDDAALAAVSFAPLTPLSFLFRSRAVFPDKIAVVD